MTQRLPQTAPAPQWLGSVNAIMVRAVHRAGQMTTPELRAHLLDVLGVEATHRLVGRRMVWLRDCGWMANTSGRNRLTVWRLAPAAVGQLAAHGLEWLPARLPGAKPPSVRAPVRRAPPAGPVTPPPRRNVLHGPAWQPPRWEPARPGADDHRQYATRGVRC